MKFVQHVKNVQNSLMRKFVQIVICNTNGIVQMCTNISKGSFNCVCFFSEQMEYFIPYHVNTKQTEVESGRSEDIVEEVKQISLYSSFIIELFVITLLSIHLFITMYFLLSDFCKC